MIERLRVNQVDVSIGNVRILSRLTITVANGEMVGLIGRNGAGKTTLLRTILGVLRPQQGDILFEGSSLLGLSTHYRAKLGIGYMPEERGLIGALSVRQNLAVPVWARKLNDLDTRIARICNIVPEIKDLMDSPALSLSGGQQKLVALGRALMCGDKMLLLDEPFEGVSPVLSQRLTEAIGRARNDGVTILLAQSDRKGRGADFDRIVHIERGANVVEAPIDSKISLTV